MSRQLPTGWEFLTSHARVLAVVAADPTVGIPGIATRATLSRRQAQQVVLELERDGCLAVTRAGRRKRYAVNRSVPIGHSLWAHRSVGDLVDLVLGRDDGPGRTTPRPGTGPPSPAQDAA